MKSMILAAGLGTRLGAATKDKPKALAPVDGKPLVFRCIERVRDAGIAESDIIVVGGYRIDVLERELRAAGFANVQLVFNDKFAEWNNFWSFHVGRDALGDAPFLQLDGDVLFDGKLIPRMLENSADASLAIDIRDELDDETMKAQRGTGVDSQRVIAISKKLDPAACVGEYVGVTKLSSKTAAQVFDELLAMSQRGDTNEYYEFAYNRLCRENLARFEVVDVHDCGVTEIDTAEDLARADEIAKTH